MQIIVVGCGKVGSSLAAVLIEQDHDVVIVEGDSQLVAAATDLDCIKITGVPIDRDVLRQAGIESADVLCAVTQSDNINIMVAQIAGLVYRVPHIIARIFNPASRSVFEAFGLDAVCSTDLTVQELLRHIDSQQASVSQAVFGSQVVYTTVPIDPQLVGESVTNLTSDTGKFVFGVLRKGRLKLARPELKIEADDELVLADLL